MGIVFVSRLAVVVLQVCASLGLFCVAALSVAFKGNWNLVSNMCEPQCIVFLCSL
jgi:hypothetical protein